MKKVLLVFLATIILVMGGCPMGGSPDTDGDPVNPINPGNMKYTREFRGEWIRMDNGDRWYITGDSISVNDAPSNLNVNLVKTSDNVVTARVGGQQYTLFAARVANASFSAQVVFLDESGTSQNAARSAIGGTGQMPPVRVRPVDQPDLERVVTPDPQTGEIHVPGIIPGDQIILIPDDPEWEDINVTVTPRDGQNVGIVPLTKGINHKVSIRMADPRTDNIAELYADGYSRDYIIEIENIGTTSSVGASYNVDWNPDDFELVSGNNIGNLDTISPGSRREIPITFRSKLINEGHKNKEIKVTITNVDTSTHTLRTWEDTVSVGYYHSSVPFRFRSQNPVQGVIKTPRGESFYFRTAWAGNGYEYSMDVPWSSENYTVVFLGATETAGSETLYSMSVGADAFPPTDWNSYAGTPEQYQYLGLCHDEATAPEINLTDNKSFWYYLYSTAEQYFKVNLGSTPPPLRIVDLDGRSIQDEPGVYMDGNANPGETINIDLRFKNSSEETRTITMTDLYAEDDYAQYVEIVRVPSGSLTLPSQYYGSLTGSSTYLNSNMVSMLNSSNINRAFQVKLSADCPVGSVKFTVKFYDNISGEFEKDFTLDVTVPQIVTAIQGVTIPVTGGIPVTTITQTDQYTGTVTWNGSPATFAGSTVYTATITLTPKPGYTLQGVAANFFTVAGASAVSNSANTGVITATFPETAAAVINISAIQGVTVPVRGGTPVTTITATDQYTGTVTWNGSPATFAGSTTYTATITLTPKPGYTLQGVAGNFFTVAGATTVSNSVNSGVITATFPQTRPPITSTTGIEMVWIPAGTFTMGSPAGEPNRYSDDETQRQVTLTNGFYMGKYQVTQEQYQTVMSTNPSYFHGGSDREPASGEVQGKRPVDRVSWYDAIVFCNRLSIMEGLDPAYSISGSTNPDNWGAVPTSSNNSTWDAVTIVSGVNGYRLPTEAQWEYACRAGTTTAYNTGASISDNTGWYWDNSNSRTHEVGKKPANAWGLYDMHGNVREWCFDWYGTYASGSQTNPTGASSGTDRVLRGGGWSNFAGYLRSAGRGYSNPYARYIINNGFRLVRP